MVGLEQVGQIDELYFRQFIHNDLRVYATRSV
jgi:hypothetical protein